MHRKLRSWLALAAIPLLSTCGNEVVGVVELIQTIEVTPGNPVLSALGLTQLFTAMARDKDGNILNGKEFTWNSTAPGIATIDPQTGLATSTGNGLARITATAEGVSGSADLNVDQVVTDLSLAEPVGPLSALGTSISLSATVTDASGSTVSTATIAWSSSDPAIVSVSSAGLATAIANGAATITASADGVTDSVSVGVIQVTTLLGLVSQPSPAAVTGVAFPQQPTIRLLDANGNTVAEGGVLVTASLSSGSGSLTGTLSASTDAAGLATFTDLAISGTGPHVLAFETTGVTPATSNTVALTPGATDPAHSTANIDSGTTAGNPVAVSIQARDAANNPVTVGGDNVAVTITGPNAVSPSVVDNGNGIYSATYAPTVAGTDVIQVTMNGSPIAGSPFTFTISPGPLNAASSTATVPNGTAGAPTPIVIQSRDAYGNTLNSGGAAATVTVSGANAATVPVTDNGDGTYSATYPPTNQGTDNVAIALDGIPVSGSPFISLVAAGNADPTKSTASAPTTTLAGTTVAWTIVSRDAIGNALLTGGEVVAISVSGANSASPVVTDVGDGTYTGSYVPTVAGADIITITLNGAEIDGSPYALSVNPGPVDAVQSTAIVPAFATANVSTPVVVTARDTFGNQQSGGGELVVVSVSGANTATPTLADEGTGRYLTSYTPTNAGTDLVAVTINGSPIAGSPFNTVVEAGGPDPAQSSATVTGTLSAGTVSDIEVTARDLSGNNLTTGGASVAVLVSGANSASLSVADNGDGTYLAAYTPTVAGVDDIAITLNGSPIGGGPYSTSITPGPLDQTTSGAVVPGGLVAGNTSNISITTRDPFGNQLTAGGATIAISVTGSNTTTPAATDNGDGTYSASYVPSTAGTDMVAIQANGSPIGGSPFSTVISSGAADPAQSSTSLPSVMTAGSTVNVLVTTRDPSGNDLSVGGEFVSVSVSGANTASPTVTDNGDGTYSASYVPTVAGTDNVGVSLNGTAISGSPFAVSINPGNAVGALSTATVPGTGISGSPTNMLIQARDGFGNAVSIGGAIVSVNISGANTATPAVSDLGDGTYGAAYAPTLSGTDFITIALNGVAVNGSPFSTLVGPGSADASQSSATVPTSAVAGVNSDITIRANDANGNPLAIGGATVLVIVTGSNSANPTVTDNGNGAYSASYTPTTTGPDNVAITLNGAAVNGSPFNTTVTPGAPDAAESVATVPTGVAGISTNVSIQARDPFGNNVTTGGATVTVNVSGANNVSPSVFDAGNGTYTTSYTPTTSGTDTISISLNGVPVAGSPFTSSVALGLVDPTQSTASVPSSGTAGSQTSITIQARDANGNALTAGGEMVVVMISGSNSVTPTVTDEGDGTYTAQYTPTTTGADNVAITLNSSPVSGSPFATTISAGAPDASQSTATVPSAGTAGAASNITVTARDAGGNLLTTGGATVMVSVSGANSASPFVIDNDDGTYSTAYTPTSVGADNIAITLNGAPISGSPFGSTIAAGAADPGNSSATVPAGTAGTTTNITVQARDAFDNALTSGGATVIITVSGANAASPAVTDVGNGTYTAAYTPTTSGTDNVAITLNGGTIAGSPYASLVAPGAANAAQSTATVPATGEVGSPTNITVQARDANGNALTTGGATVVITVSGSNSATPPVTDEGDGTYTAQYTPSTTGADDVAITLNGSPISGSPFASTVNAGSANASQSTATVPTTGTAGAATAITVQARDGSGNPVTSGGATVVIAVSGANAATPTVTDVGDGTYAASYTPTVAGGDNIAITLNGGAISGSPFTSTVDPGAVSAPQSTASVPNGSIAVSTEITVQARDVNGNALTAGGESVVVTVTGSNSASPTVTDQIDGTYTASYTPTNGGIDNVVITLNGTQISGSPFTSDVAGGVDPSQSTASVPASGTPGIATLITVQARDAVGNPIATGGETVVITVSGTNTASPTVTDVGDGTYTASYTPGSVGADDIEITMNGAVISGSPFTSIISADNTGDPSNTFAIVPNGTPGDVTTLTVRARDAADNNVTTGGGAVAISISGTNSASPAVTDNGDGTYTATYTPSSAGSDDVAITLNGTPIEGSPYTSTVSAIVALTGKISYERLPSAFDLNSDVIVMNEDGTGMVNLTDNTNFSDERPGISPDGTKIVFNSNRDGDQDIYVMNSNGSNVVQLTDVAGRDRLPVWSPDGTKILFLSERDGDSDIWVMNADGSGATALTINSVDDYQADWSPDGTQIAFYASDGGDFEVFTMDADGTNRTVILDLPDSREVEVSWGLGGIAFISDMDTGGFPNPTQIYKIQPDGTGLTRLTNHSDWDYMPEWSADGTRIVFITGRDGNGGEIYVMNADGTNQTRLTVDSGAEWAPKFQY